MNQDQIGLYRAFGDVLVFDSTYDATQFDVYVFRMFDSSRYTLKLVNFVVTDNENRTRLVATALIKSEKTEDYEWVLECLRSISGCKPKVTLTDQAASIAAAIRNVYGCIQMKCGWHKQENLNKYYPSFWDQTAVRSFVKDYHFCVFSNSSEGAFQRL
jgi:hypothetical protein